MIVAEQKPLEDIRRMIAPYERVLIVGCGTCVTVCGAGGEREVSLLHAALQLAQARNGEEAGSIAEYTVKRQCDLEFLDVLAERVEDADVVLSLGCGVGVQTLVERFPNALFVPGVNTSFMGAAREWGVWDERCAGCGDCRLADTGGICPITRCTKGILNGPCAGAKHGKCEASKEMDCAWILIYQQLERLGQLERMRRYYAPRNFQAIPRPHRLVTRAETSGGGGNG